MEERKRSIDLKLNLNLAVQVLLIVLLCVSCALMIHLTILTRRVSRTIDESSAEIAAVAATAKRIAEQVDKLEMRVSHWLKAVKADEIVSTIDEAARIAQALVGNGVEMGLGAKAEIAHLLSKVRQSGLKFEYSGKVHSAMRFYLQLLAKHKAYEKTLVSAEHFVAKVATRTVTGKTYYVVAEDGSKRELAEWLLNILHEYRARESE